MIDGKVANVLTDTSSNAVCRVCKAAPSTMNKIPDLLTRAVQKDTLRYGLSPMHCRIRALEWILHVSYRDVENVRCTRIRLTDEQRDTIKVRKRFIQKHFKSSMGLNIDMPAAGGTGNTDDGNTARRVFHNFIISSQITGFDEEIMEHLGVILDVINSGYAVDAVKFREYTLKIAFAYISKYPWYDMPASMHILLIHGADFITNFMNMPLGALSEEAQESRNKDLKRYRTVNTRKMSRTLCNLDLMHILLTSSDPVISTINEEHVKDRQFKISLREEVINLLETPKDPTEVIHVSDSSDLDNSSDTTNADTDNDSDASEM